MSRQIARANDAPGSERQDLLHAILEFAHIPRPGVVHQVGCGLVRERGCIPFIAVTLEEDLRESGDIALAFAQSRQPDRDHVQAIKQILAKRALIDGFLQVPVGCCNDARVNPGSDVAAQCLDLPLLQRAQELHLQFQGQLADFVEKHRSAAGGGKQSLSILGGTRKGSPDVAKEFALDQGG